MSNASGVSRGDRNRNARLARLRSAVPVTNAIVGIDLADRKQMVVVTDHQTRHGIGLGASATSQAPRSSSPPSSGAAGESTSLARSQIGITPRATLCLPPARNQRPDIVWRWPSTDSLKRPHRHPRPSQLAESEWSLPRRLGRAVVRSLIGLMRGESVSVRDLYLAKEAIVSVVKGRTMRHFRER